MSWQKILVGLDNSHLSPQIFETALDLAKIYGARLNLIQCLSNDGFVQQTLPVSPDISVFPEMVNLAYENQPLSLEYQLQEVESRLRSYCDLAQAQNVSPEFECVFGDPGERICQIAKQWEANLIVIGRRGRRGLTEALLGSVSNHVLHNAPCSVLIIQEVAPKAN